VRWKKILGLSGAGVLLLVALLEGAGLYIASRQARAAAVPAIHNAPPTETPERRNQRLVQEMTRLRPKGIYLVADTARNRLFVHKDDKVIREVVVSCGSGSILEDPTGKRRWVFDTPRGEFTIQSRLVNPYWVKPDWAFVEEGEPIPKKFADRIERGVLGNYALGFGKGYFIHGTLYTRLLGRSITHGCIRAGDEDIAALYREVPIGAKLLIF
jgi:L,D-transpeptidase YbiS